MKFPGFWTFGILQSLSLGFIIFLVFRALNMINGGAVIEIETQIVLSIMFPVFLLRTEFEIMRYLNNQEFPKK